MPEPRRSLAEACEAGASRSLPVVSRKRKRSARSSKRPRGRAMSAPWRSVKAANTSLVATAMPGLTSSIGSRGSDYEGREFFATAFHEGGDAGNADRNVGPQFLRNLAQGSVVPISRRHRIRQRTQCRSRIGAAAADAGRHRKIFREREFRPRPATGPRRKRLSGLQDQIVAIRQGGREWSLRLRAKDRRRPRRSDDRRNP